MLHEQRPMRPRELVQLGLTRRLFSDRRAGKTPWQTMKSKLSVHVRRKGKNSTFVRTGPNQFFLRRLVPGDVYEAPPQQKPESTEQVLVFPSALLRTRDRFQGISRNFHRLQARILKPDVSFHIDRLRAESDNDHKQVLTYVMITRRGRVLAFKRGSYNRVEDFLRGAHCIGFGGHVSKTDVDLFSLSDMGVVRSASRELFEELRLPAKDIERLKVGKGLKLVGLLNDDSSLVGQRHLAFLFTYEVSNDRAWAKPERGEKSITQLRWLSPNSGTVPIWDFEYWSQLCLREYFPQIAHAVPQHRIVRRVPLRPPHLLCVLGEVGSGKSEATRLITREFDYEEINSGRIVAEILGIPPVGEYGRDRFQQKAGEFIKRADGPQRLADAIWTRVQKVSSGKVLIDGIRQRTTLNCLQQLAGNLQIGVLYVHTLPDLAYKFYRAREQPRLSIFEFLERRNAEVERDVAGMISVADAVLYNWIGRAEYQQAICDLMETVMKEQV
ncbi:MAG TPA: HTH domain-containing protein [Tepidisphaeraceae bacterium]|nr:HTH domain-containing protein [Tepidisphaeraceae bacterium]